MPEPEGNDAAAAPSATGIAATSQPGSEPAAAAKEGSAAPGAEATGKPTVSSEEMESVAYCREYLESIAKSCRDQGANLVAALKVTTTLGASSHQTWSRLWRPARAHLCAL